jgi:hypothetical protein
MPTGDSVIRVTILGDAKALNTAINTADSKLKGFAKSTAFALGGAFVGLRALQGGVDFIGDSLQEADRLGDAMERLNLQLGPQFTDRLKDTADNFASIGASTQDILALEAIFADFATTAGIADPQIASLAESVAATATALTLTDEEGRDAQTMLDLVTKAATGSEKAARELGVTLTANATPTQQLVNILAQLDPKLQAATTGTGDLETKQAALQARIETLQGEIGEGLMPAFEGILSFFAAVLEDIPETVKGFEDLGNNIVNFGKTVLGPLGNVRDVLQDILSTFGLVEQRGTVTVPSVFGERNTIRRSQDFYDRNGLPGRAGVP